MPAPYAGCSPDSFASMYSFAFGKVPPSTCATPSRVIGGCFLFHSVLSGFFCFHVIFCFSEGVPQHLSHTHPGHRKLVSLSIGSFRISSKSYFYGTRSLN